MKSVIASIAPPLCLFVNLTAGIEGQSLQLQKTTELRGAVADETGAVIIAATVTVDDGQYHKYVVTTNEQGQYRFPKLETGL